MSFLLTCLSQVVYRPALWVVAAKLETQGIFSHQVGLRSYEEIVHSVLKSVFPNFLAAGTSLTRPSTATTFLQPPNHEAKHTWPGF